MSNIETKEALDRDIVRLEASLRELSEQAAAASGAANEEAIATRIEEQQTRLDDLQARREALDRA